ncbi:hypothetical protein GOV13_00780 [Candidatus Pacearchaeota archaeon]|nr:hypothetical protein [Candidatus Pacearchaeota archaeon]
MLNKTEIIAILLSTLVLGFVISLISSLNAFFTISLTVFIIIMINIISKKVMSYYFDSETEVSLWSIKRSGLSYFFGAIIPFASPHPSKKFKKPFPSGLFFPIITTAFSFGYINWMSTLVFDVKAKTYKAAKRHGLYTFSEMAENQIGLIAAAGIVANLAFAIVGYLIGYNDFSRLSIYYALYNMIPISDLDGNKIYFGSSTFVGFPLMWGTLALITLIGVGYALFLI